MISRRLLLAQIPLLAAGPFRTRGQGLASQFHAEHIAQSAFIFTNFFTNFYTNFAGFVL